MLLLIIGAVITAVTTPQTGSADDMSSAIEAPTIPATHQIEGVKAALQDTLLAGCETHACTGLLQYLGYDIDEFR